jgi:hypothetical protein
MIVITMPLQGVETKPKKMIACPIKLKPSINASVCSNCPFFVAYAFTRSYRVGGNLLILCNGNKP